MSFIPTVNGKVHHFGAVGLANGLAVLADEETRTYWDHITGEAFMGPHKGVRLEAFPMQMTTVEAMLHETPDAPIFISQHRSWVSFALGFVFRGKFLSSKGFLPPPFHATMSKEIDMRLPKLEQGLGVMVGKKAKFYPMSAIPKEGSIEDDWDGKTLVLARGEIDRVPYAAWKDNHARDDRPMQMLSRWYGYSFTYPHCEVYQPSEKHRSNNPTAQ